MTETLKKITPDKKIDSSLSVAKNPVLMEKKGIFCVIEGIDGSGKSSLLHRLSIELEGMANRTLNRELFLQPSSSRAFASIVSLREPSDLPSGKKIRENLKRKTPLSDEEWLEDFINDREANVKQNILPAVENGSLVLQDRYYYSTAAYQGATGSLTPEVILKKNRDKGFPEPDILFYIDITPEEALERIRKNGRMLEYFETIERLENISRAFKKILPPNCATLKGSLSPDELCKEAMKIILSRIK